MINPDEALRRRCDELEAKLLVLAKETSDRIAKHEQDLTMLTAAVDEPDAMTRHHDKRIEAIEGDIKAEKERRVNEAAGLPPNGRQYRTLHSWVESFFVRVYARSPHGDTKWCAHWARHREAVERLTALWWAWEDCWPGNKRERAVWFKDYADSIVRDLMSPDGTFKGCTKDRHQKPTPLPSWPAS